MSLIVSVSGIRGTIGGLAGHNLTPVDMVKFASAYSQWLKIQYQNPIICIGRDGRISGDIVSGIVSSTIRSMGIQVIDLGLSTTPTVEMAVIQNKTQGGIILTASHNPKEWNALKLLNDRGEFLSAKDGEYLLKLSNNNSAEFETIDNLGSILYQSDAITKHIKAILDLDFIPVQEIRNKKFHIVADCINSTGALALPELFDALGCSYTLINDTISGNFAHNPEPLPENLSDLLAACKSKNAIGVAVDPDVDRLALVDNRGQYFGEEYTLVTVADYILQLTPGNTVSNLSSSRALADMTRKYGGQYFASAVGEAHVVQKMKENNAVIGGEGNGGIILPDLHYGRDSLVGIALVLANICKSGKSLHELKLNYPAYEMYKDKIAISESIPYDALLDFLKNEYKSEKLNTIDGLKIDMENAWLHLRKSNTEPIIRIYSEANSKDEAASLVDDIKNKITKFKP